jgi:dipeptidyl aminopeptidase/acylaminoacyl peptidase
VVENNKRRFAPEDIYRMRTAADPHIAPDGKLVAMVVTTTDRAANRFRSNIWGVPLDGGQPRRLTAGPKADSHPRWSPDGRLAFLSDRSREHEAEEAGGGGKSQIWLLDMNGGEARQLTFVREGVSGFAWSPDGGRIAFIAEIEEPALVEAEDSIRKLGAKMLSFTTPAAEAEPEQPTPPTDSSGVPGMEGGEERVVVQPVGEEPGLGEGEKVEANRSKVITRLHYKFDGTGFFETKRSHIFAIDVPPASDFEAIFSEQDAIGKPKPKDKNKQEDEADKNLNERLKKAKERDPRDRSRQLTFGDYDDAEPTWTRDGRLIFVSNRLEDRDRRTSMSDLFIVDTANLSEGQQPEPRQLTRSQGLAIAPTISPDGRQLAYAGHNQGDDSSGVVSTHVWLRDLDGEAEFRDLTAGFDRSIGGEGATIDTPRLCWSADGRALYFLAGDRGNSSLFRLPLDGGKEADNGPERGTPLHRLVSGDRRLFAFDLSADGQIAFTAASTFHHSDLFACAADGSGERRLTNLMGSVLGEMDLGTVEKFSIENEGLPLDSWILKPPDFDPTKKYPLVLQIHGGPQGSFGDGWVIFNILLAARGYVVVYANCRGSSSYGEQFARGCFNDWGGGDYRDLMAALDHVIAQGYIDETRLGVTGYSYGGYMTNWVVTQTNRFKAAVTQASLSNMFSDWGTCDTGTTFDNDQFGAPPFDDASLYLERSAITHARNVSTPLLILHSEADYRCMMEQAEQFYTALKWLGKEVAFVRFPNESHGLFRKGQPRHAVEWVSLMLGWFDKYL